MDYASFGLSEAFRVFHQAGIRHLLPAPPAAVTASQAGQGATGRTEDSGQASTAREAPSYIPAWEPILAKIPARPLALITYLELGSDLTGSGDPARSALWRRMIGHLQLPKGSLGFLPFAFHDANTVHVFPDAFRQHCQRYAPRFLLVFGRAACVAACPAHDAHWLQGSHVLRECPSPHELADMGHVEFALFCDTLRQDLMGYEVSST